MAELYGSENTDTGDWTDGLASKTLRKFTKKAAASLSKKEYWTIFDGPVDAKWIENMNTVLDDNMLLSLASGERIKLDPRMKVMFEVSELT